MAHIFHLAIPVNNLEEAINFYRHKLECPIGRQNDDRVSFNFFGAQLVCHLSPEDIDIKPKMYPRHFGITFEEKKMFDKILDKVTNNRLSFYKKPFSRFKGKREEHITFFLVDPANNLIEFKYYPDKEMMY